MQILRKETNPEFHWDVQYVIPLSLPALHRPTGDDYDVGFRQRHRYRRWDQQSAISFASLVLFLSFIQIFTAMRAVDACITILGCANALLNRNNIIDNLDILDIL